MGSNPAGVFEDENGRRYYVKSLESAAHARNELIAASLYRLAGVPTLNYLATTVPNQLATELVHLDKKDVAHLSPAERKQAQRWFGVHAWTANWDAAGFMGDNQGVVDGVVLTLDLGGALEYRAMGNQKGRAFGCTVSELETMRLDPANAFSVKLFGDMDEAGIETAIKVVTSLSDDAIRRSIAELGGSDALVEKILARKAYMASRIGIAA